MTVAKSLAGGFPLAGVVGRAEIMDAPAPGGLGGTYAGSPIACAAALAVLDVIEKEKLCERAELIGAQIVGRLRGLAMEVDVIGELRNLGAMVAMELVKGGDPHQPDADLAKAVLKHAAAKGLVLLSCGIYGNVLRILVPLTASDAIINEGLDILAATLRELAGSEVKVAASA
jgi:4-aminobutyrate aminotransferase/(S)-3-amino-2-methylpropionate transaminase